MGVVLAICGRALATDAGGAPLPEAGALAPITGVTEVWLVVRVNGAPMATPVRLARQADGRLLATAVDLARWRIRAPTVAPVLVKGRRYLPLEAIAGLSYRVDEREQLLTIEGRPEVFDVTRLAPRRTEFSPPDVAAAGGFVNYDLQASAYDGVKALSGLLELGVFNRFGFGSTSFLGYGGDAAQRPVRLDTTWTRDFPSQLASLSVGDGIGRAGAWGRSLRFGGLQWATNFATRPDFVPFQLPSVKGEAALPSTVDLYVDNVLRMSRSVPYGPFEVANAPVISGDGQVRLVVRDLLGRETVMMQPYYVSTALLQPGLRDEAYELGFVRRRYASASNDYGPLFGAATLRAGLDERTTAEFRAELQDRQQTIGAAASFIVESKVVASAALALSHRPEGMGSMLSLGVERQGRPLSFGLETRLATPRFAQLGGWPEFDVPRRSHIARASFAAGRGGSVFASWVHQVGQEGSGGVRFVTAGYNIGLADQVYLSLFGLRSLAGDRAHSVGLNLTWVLGARTTGSASRTQAAGGSTDSVQVQQSLPQGSGAGYRLTAGSGAGSHQQAALLLQNAVGAYSLEAASLQGSTGYRASASGGVAYLAGRAYLSRRIEDSFAVVKVGDYAGIDVFLDNQPVARTDGDGNALVPRLRPYQRNIIAIQPEHLPLDAEFTDLRLELTPARRSAASALFPVRPARGALLRIVLDDGTPLPSGAVVSVDAGSEEFPVARRGEAYVKGLALRSLVQARWKGQRCDIEVPMPAQAGPMPVIGPLVCHGVWP